MATTPPTPPAPAIDWKKAEDHLAAIKKKIMEYSGKPNCNPHMWWRDNGEQLEKQLADTKNRTPELHKRILEVAFEEPKAPAMGVKIKKRTPLKPS